MKHYFILTAAILFLSTCQPKKEQAQTQETKPAASAEVHNTLSESERAEGWILLFDGTTTSGWRNYNSSTIGAAWKVSNGELWLESKKLHPEGRGHIITDGEFENFELLLDWKIDSCGNSGIVYNIIEDPKYRVVYETGPEMQILDNSCHPDAKINKHRAGDLYDLKACSTETVNPAGEWNRVKIVSNNANYEFWLNDVQVVTFSMHTPEWNEMVKSSKFKDWPDFGKFRKGHISLTDHDDRVWYRNIKIKPL